MERDLIVIAVWALVISSAAQGLIHFTTFAVLHRQESQTSVGDALDARELSLCVKNTFRTMFDVLVAVFVTWDRTILMSPWSTALYATVTITTAVAILYGVNFIKALWMENWGKPDERTVRQDLREHGLDDRADRADMRGRAQDEQGAALDRRSHEQDERERVGI